MRLTVTSVDGVVSELESVESFLRDSNLNYAPGLDQRLAQLTCPDHGCKLNGLSVEYVRLSEDEHAAFSIAGVQLGEAVLPYWTYKAECTPGGCCEKLEKLAEETLEQENVW